MKVLVTGAGGFAGGYAARRLAVLGADVVALTRSSPVTLPDDAEAAARFSVVHTDLAAGDDLPAVDAVVHAAATSIWDGITVDQMLGDNVAATQALVRHALACEAKAFVFFSSFSAFGDVAGDVVSDATPSVNPDAYGLTKLLGERLLEDVKDQLPSLSIRLPAVIGPGSKRNWLSECVRKLKAGLPLSYVNPDVRFNNGCHIEDLTQMIFGWLSGERTGAHMTAVGAGGDMVVRDVVARLAQGLDTTSEISVGDRELRTFLIDSSRAQNEYGYAPMSVSDMLNRFIAENR